jgi:hypothetical protein
MNERKTHPESVAIMRGGTKETSFCLCHQNFSLFRIGDEEEPFEWRLLLFVVLVCCCAARRKETITDGQHDNTLQPPPVTKPFNTISFSSHIMRTNTKQKEGE